VIDSQLAAALFQSHESDFSRKKISTANQSLGQSYPSDFDCAYLSAPFGSDPGHLNHREDFVVNLERFKAEP